MASLPPTENYAGSDGSSSSQPLASPTGSAPNSSDKNSNNNDGGSGEGSKTKVSRKRTKTGCLTCRKRRIKCGEERPTCNNCIKSKRNCEGYNQRVVFKDGMNGLFPRAMGPTDRRFPTYAPLQPAPGPQPLQPIAPAPSAYPGREDHMVGLDQGLHLQPAYNPARINIALPLASPAHPSPSHGEFDPASYHRPQDDYYLQHTPSSATASNFPRSSPSSEPGSASLFGPPPTPFTPSFSSTSSHRPFVASHPSASSSPNSCPFNPPIDRKYAMVSGGSGELTQPSTDFNSLFPNPEGSGAGGAMHPAEEFAFETGLSITPEEYAIMTQGTDIDYDQESEDDLLEEEEEEEDFEYRVGTQEDGLIAMDTQDMGVTQQQITKVLEPFSRDLDERTRIAFTSFLPDMGVMATYTPSLSSSPLMNPVTAKIFCHFVYVLGPSMSLFERFPPNPHIAFTPGAGLHGPQNVWSYTVPMLSLQHPPLLHAILALSSLHISKLTKGSENASFLHYQFALRRLGKAIASDRHRRHVATLAATLMLAYYETMAAEHDKWSSHIHGAKQLLKEIDFDRVTRRVEQCDDEPEQPQRMAGVPGGAENRNGPSLFSMRKIRRQMISEDVDDSLKSYFMGNKANRATQNKSKRRENERAFSKKEMDTLKLQADMFWFYAKMDCFQSLLSGCPLILEYIHWGQCPPRARIGTLGTTYGSSDHFFLLLGRLCDFQSRDLERKKALAKANGGQWVPPPEMGGPPRGHRGPPPGFQGPPPNMSGMKGPPPNMNTQQPGMNGPPVLSPTGEPVQFGMIPPRTTPLRMPRGFGNNPLINPHTNSEFDDLDAATLDAEREWKEIHKAFLVLQESLGCEYQPLGIEYMPAHPTPFGPAIYYKTYSIASLQLLYNMSMIVLHRCHPDMPPMTMMAAGIQARKTQPYATDIARILAGLVPTDISAQINPALGASLIEASIPIFFAAVQYDTQDQRDWTIKKLREIHRLTGWTSASRILLGCQRAWEKSAEMGQSPEYIRPPFEEEGEMYNEYYNYYVGLQNGAKDEATEAGGEEGRYLWKTMGRRTVDAAGILGERDLFDMNDLGV